MSSTQLTHVDDVHAITLLRKTAEICSEVRKGTQLPSFPPLHSLQTYLLN